MPRLKSVNREQKTDTDGVAARVGGRLKKAKIVFDPSDLPRKQTRSLSVYSERSSRKDEHQTSSDEPETLQNHQKSNSSPPEMDINPAFCCMICGKTGDKQLNKLIACKDCNYKVHASCLTVSFLNTSILEEFWRCDNCRMCAVCYETSEVGPLVSCRICVEAYHFNCHPPRIPRNVNKTKWECSKCQKIERVTSKNSIRESHKSLDMYIGNNVNIINNKNETEIPETTKRDDEKKSTTITTPRAQFPDISDWTAERVAEYFQPEFPREANKLREHDIDGATLLLLKRSDVISGMSLRLGPAIRLYTRIVQLQAKSGDPCLTWM